VLVATTHAVLCWQAGAESLMWVAAMHAKLSFAFLHLACMHNSVCETRCAPVLEKLLSDLVAGCCLLLALHCDPDHVGTRVCALLHLQGQTEAKMNA